MNKINNLWLRLNALVPNPQCTTLGDDYDAIVWSDARKIPTAAELEAVDLAPLMAAAEAKQSAKLAAAGEFRSLTALASKTDAQIAAWVDANVTDLASAKTALKILARAVGALARDRGM